MESLAEKLYFIGAAILEKEIHSFAFDPIHNPNKACFNYGGGKLYSHSYDLEDLVSRVVDLIKKVIPAERIQAIESLHKHICESNSDEVLVVFSQGTPVLGFLEMVKVLPLPHLRLLNGSLPKLSQVNPTWDKAIGSYFWNGFESKTLVSSYRHGLSELFSGDGFGYKDPLKASLTYLFPSGLKVPRTPKEPTEPGDSFSFDAFEYMDLVHYVNLLKKIKVDSPKETSSSSCGELYRRMSVDERRAWLELIDLSEGLLSLMRGPETVQT
jgi:hypothetical protein